MLRPSRIIRLGKRNSLPPVGRRLIGKSPCALSCLVGDRPVRLALALTFPAAIDTPTACSRRRQSALIYPRVCKNAPTDVGGCNTPLFRQHVVAPQRAVVANVKAAICDEIGRASCRARGR